MHRLHARLPDRARPKNLSTGYIQTGEDEINSRSTFDCASDSGEMLAAAAEALLTRNHAILSCNTRACIYN